MADMPLLRAETADEEIRLMAAGAWTAANAAELERRMEAVASDASTARPAVVDMRAIEQLDTYGALLLERLSRAWAGRGQSMRVVALADRYQGLLRELHAFNPPQSTTAPHEKMIVQGLKSLDRSVAIIQQQSGPERSDALEDDVRDGPRWIIDSDDGNHRPANEKMSS